MSSSFLSQNPHGHDRRALTRTLSKGTSGKPNKIKSPYL